MTWQEHAPHKFATDSKPFYTYTLATPDNEEYYAAYIVQTEDGFKATVPERHEIVRPRGQEKALKPYHYTHDTLQDAKDWCIAELWKRRLDQ
jgi:hypothetical protein